METLTKEQRHEAYKIALEKIKSGEELFMCNAVLRAHFKSHDISGCSFSDFDFFELNDKKPSNASHAWFGLCDKNAIQKRIEILEQCIKETE